MNYSASGEVVEAVGRQPPVAPPAPMCLNGVHQAGDEDGEEDVSVELGPFGDGSRHYCHARSSKGALERISSMPKRKCKRKEIWGFTFT